MLVVQLPPLPTVSVLDGNTFESVIICRFVSLSGQTREFNLSQRQLLSLFNRSGQRAMGKYLKKAESKGLIRKARVTKGLLADAYSRGEFFSADSQESRRLIKLSHSLWGRNGLLRSWPYPTAWGHGCLPGAAILSLATLRLLEESISKKSLREYLSALVPQSSFNSGIKFLFEKHLVYGEGDRLLIAPDWESKLELWLDMHSACNGRQEEGDKRRAEEIESNRVRVQKGKLTDAESKQLLALPCVVKGCKSKRHQMEHFPPRHFLKQLDVITNRYFVWSICRTHNRQMADFIKALDSTVPIPPNLLEVKPGTDPMRIYSASANRGIQKFYSAFQNKDQDAATVAIRLVIGLWKAINDLPEDYEVTGRQSLVVRREKVGKRAYSPDRSKLSYHTN
jgi:hypothetical protein